MTKDYKIITTFDYRGIHLDLYLDELNQELFTFWPKTNELVSFGSYNADFREDARYLIDRQLDFIAEDFGEGITGARLEYFDNAGHRDIRLVYQGRVIKIFLVVVASQINKSKLIAKSRQILLKLI